MDIFTIIHFQIHFLKSTCPLTEAGTDLYFNKVSERQQPSRRFLVLMKGFENLMNVCNTTAVTVINYFNDIN